MKARDTLEKVVGKKTGFFSSWFRSRTDLKDLKAHQERLKTLCPILSLAITTSQQTTSAHPAPPLSLQQQPPLKKPRIDSDSQGTPEDTPLGGSQGDNSDSPTRRLSGGEGKGFDAARLLKNEETRDFWLLHFGAKVLFSPTRNFFLAGAPLSPMHTITLHQFKLVPLHS